MDLYVNIINSVLNPWHMGGMCLLIALLHFQRSREKPTKRGPKRAKATVLVLFAIVWYIIALGLIKEVSVIRALLRFMFWGYMLFELAYYLDDILRWASELRSRIGAS